jgi:hypothetical protein
MDILQVPVLAWGDGANCCDVLESRVLIHFLQVLRN